MKLDKGIRVKAGVVDGMVFGGPYRFYAPGTRRLIGVKMAKEIDMPCDISIPTEDFSVPDTQTLTMGVNAAFTALSKGKDVYVGCMGGIGRTGLFMAVLAKALAHYHDDERNPVSFVRAEYNHHAVETLEQMKYVSNFDVRPLVKHLTALNAPKIEYVRCSVWQCIKRMFGFEV